MKKYFVYVALVLLIAGCFSTPKEKEFIGVWINEEEKCRIKLNKDFTFTSTNLPYDVMNEYSIFKKETITWKGKWSLDNNQLMLRMGKNYYYLDIGSSLISSEPELHITLLEESGGQRIFFRKQ